MVGHIKDTTSAAPASICPKFPPTTRPACNIHIYIVIEINTYVLS